MKKFLLYISIVAIVAACSSQKADKHSEAYLTERVTAIYDDVFGVYNENNTANGWAVISQRNFENDYCSKDFNDVVKQVEEYDKAHAEEDDLGYYESDYWIQGQDWSDLSMKIESISELQENSAKVRVIITNFGEDELVELPMVFERGDWYIDEFGSKDEEGSDKAYFRRIISDGLKVRQKAKTLVGEWGWVGDDGPELILSLKMTDHGLKAGQCDVYRLYGFDKTGVTFDGELLSVTEYEYDDKAKKTVRDFNLYVRLNEQGDLTGTCRIVHPLASKEYDGPITLRKGYFKYRD